ncbi:hypothetical protein QJS66_21990 [Kocuria rhizophila]|nr:hypothetical protein QJS66_21990 [Kocuria rhizophila]
MDTPHRADGGRRWHNSLNREQDTPWRIDRLRDSADPRVGEDTAARTWRTPWRRRRAREQGRTWWSPRCTPSRSTRTPRTPTAAHRARPRGVRGLRRRVRTRLHSVQPIGEPPRHMDRLRSGPQTSPSPHRPRREPTTTRASWPASAAARGAAGSGG